jgi:hypothetical protein
MRCLTLLLIAFIIYSCGKSDEKQVNQTDASVKQAYLKKGGEIAQLTQAELLKNVTQAMKEGGPEYAIAFCNLKALALKDSLSRLHNCEIKRIAAKYRNPADKPQSDGEVKQLSSYQTAHQDSESIGPEVYLFEDRIEYYKPIMVTMEACLRCHGDPEKDIADATLEEINTRYPDDRATGFTLNDFRGAWKITFGK